MSLDDFEWEWNHRTDAEKQKYEASLKVAHERELAWLAEMAAKAAREATLWFRFTAPMNTLFQVVASLLVIAVVAVTAGFAFCYITTPVRTPFELAVVLLLGAILLVVAAK